MTTKDHSETGNEQGAPDVAGPTAACCGSGSATPVSGGWSCSPAAMMAGAGRPGESADETRGDPMTSMCQRMMRGRCGSGRLLWLPALAMLAMGVAMLFAPQFLTWLAAGALICAGAAILVAAGHLRRRNRQKA